MLLPLLNFNHLSLDTLMKLALLISICSTKYASQWINCGIATRFISPSTKLFRLRCSLGVGSPMSYTVFIYINTARKHVMSSIIYDISFLLPLQKIKLKLGESKATPFGQSKLIVLYCTQCLWKVVSLLIYRYRLVHVSFPVFCLSFISFLFVFWYLLMFNK